MTSSRPSAGLNQLQPQHTGRVLIVDDVEAVGMVVARALSTVGFEVEYTNDGHDALERLSRTTFDAIVSDIQMPKLDGISLLRAVRTRDLDVPVLLMTGHPAIETARKAIEYGAIRYLLKPVMPAELREQVARAVRLGRIARIRRTATEVMGEDSMAIGDRAGLEACFQRALSGLWTAYQPIVRGSDHTVIAFEALMRSREPQLSHPGAVLSAAQRLDQLPLVGRTMRNNVGRAVGDADIPLVFVNLHPLDLLDDELYEPDAPLTRIAKRVVLEVTERCSLDEVADIESRIARLRELGFRIAIDDVGAGYAGLTSVAQLEPEVMKVDMSLVRDIERSRTKQNLVSAMANFCRDSNLLVIAEGVETIAERDSLRALGCDLMQGYLFAKPGWPFPQAQFPS